MIRALLRDSAVYGIASILSRGMGIFLIPLYTRVLSTAEYGVFDLILTFGALANLVVALEVTQGLARHWTETPAGAAQKNLASTALWFTIGAYGAFALVALLAAPVLTPLLLQDARYEDAFRLGVLFITANGIYLLLLNQLRWELRSRAYGVISVAYAVLTLALASLLCLGLDMDLSGILLAQALAAGLAGLAALLLLRETFGFRWDGAQLRQMLAFSAPLVPSALATFLNLYVSRLILSQTAPLEEVGEFALAMRIAGLVNLVMFGVQAALTPLIYRHYQEPDTPPAIARIFNWFAAGSLVIWALLVIFSRDIVAIFSTDAFAGAAPLIAVLVPASIFMQAYIFFPGIPLAKKTLSQLRIMAIAALIGVAVGLVLIPSWGAWGAALANLAASTCFIGLWISSSQRLYPIPVRFWPWLLALVLAAGTFYGLSRF